jgi:hypothetical protein
MKYRTTLVESITTINNYFMFYFLFYLLGI